MNFAILTNRIQERIMEIYRLAAQRHLSFSPYGLNQTPKYLEIENLYTFTLYCLYLDGFTSRIEKDNSGYFLAPISRKRIPLFQTIAVPNEPWTSDDDDDIGCVAMRIVERKPFEQSGGVLHSVETFLGYFIEATATPKDIILRARLLHEHMVAFRVADYFQVSFHIYTRRRCLMKRSAFRWVGGPSLTTTMSIPIYSKSGTRYRILRSQLVSRANLFPPSLSSIATRSWSKPSPALPKFGN